MKNPEEEVERLLEYPIREEHGGIFINRRFETPIVELSFARYPGRSFGSSYLFSPEEWVRVVEVMRAYFQQEVLDEK